MTPRKRIDGMGSRKKQVVLVGAGHAHLHVAARAEHFTGAGIRLVLIEPGMFWYSGLATGMLAGQYSPQVDQIDPEPLIRRGGGDFLRDRLTGIDRRRRVVTLASGDTVEYDALSLNIGSEIDAEGTPGAREHAWTVKPISDLWRLRQHLETRLMKPSRAPTSAIIVGGGPTGCEIAACLRALASRRGGEIRLRVLSRADRLAAGLPPRASRTLTRHLLRHGVEVSCSWPVDRIEDGGVIHADGRQLLADVIVFATGLRAPSLLKSLDLPLDGDGSLRVRSTLQSVGDDRVLAVGDCASLEAYQLPKLGVFGVRQGPVLLRNLLCLIQGGRLERYRPQRRCLMILNLGCGQALAIYGGLHWLGGLSFWIKDHIDRRFMARYR